MDSIGKGIMAGLEEMESNGAEEHNSKSIKEPKSKSVKVKRVKRSFMLTDEEIEMVYKLKIKFRNEDYSDIVGRAIKEYFDKCNIE